jgi:hypothetical protein
MTSARVVVHPNRSRMSPTLVEDADDGASASSVVLDQQLVTSGVDVERIARQG